MSEYSAFDKRTLNDIYKEIQEVYLSDERAWVVAFSGGKDSTVILQLIWEALKLLPEEKRKKTIEIVSSDTMVESPVLSNYVNRIHAKIKIESKKQNLPFNVKKVHPKITETFWVNVVGKGYPAPTKLFRWCTARLKINPIDEFIFNEVSNYGEIILALGVRSEESVARAQSINSHKIEGSLLSRHAKFPQAYTYSPIADFTTEDVWTYLLQKESPWGMDNNELLSMYSGKNSEECPLVVDKNSPSCGGSRFGCWTCTLVKNDKVMVQMVNDGNTQMKPLMELRILLYKTTIPENKAEYRQYKGRNGRLRLKDDGTIIRGPYKFEFSKEIFSTLIKIQKGLNESKAGFSVITDEEIHEIRRLWINERGDWEDSVPKIYEEIMGSSLEWVEEDLGLFSNDERSLLVDMTEKENIPFKLIQKLLDVEKQIQGMSRRSTIYSKIDKVLKEEWRSEKEIIKSIQEKNDN